jgi:aspartyl-tRNA(Asn)/glutamyl-tRNA(Gln) amidotransferase subunit A
MTVTVTVAVRWRRSPQLHEAGGVTGADAMPTVVEAAAAVRNRTRSARELLELCLDAAGRAESLNAFAHIDGDGARAAADDVDRRIARGDDVGPLGGVPFAVKDLERCAGMPMTKASRWYAGNPPDTTDDIHVSRLRAAGAVPFAKSTTPEFGTWAFTASPLLGVTRNPWALDRTPGGSSGGTAAAVAAGVMPFGTASDGGGSIRTPASFTGLPGLKPSYGRIPTFSVTHLSQNAVVGSLAATVSDTALLLDVMSGPSRYDRTSLPAPGIRYAEAVESLDVAGMRAAWSPDLGFAVVEPGVAKVCEAAMRRLVDAAGLRLVDVPIAFDDYIGVYTRIEGIDQFVGVPPGLYPERADELDPSVRPGWDWASQQVWPKLARTYDRRRAIEHQLAAIFDEVDVLITPMSAMPAFAAAGPMPTEIAGQHVHGGMAVIFAMLANFWGSPAMSVPAGVVDGLPVGLQIMADRHRDDVCLRLARLYEQASAWPRHAPGW